MESNGLTGPIATLAKMILCVNPKPHIQQVSHTSVSATARKGERRQKKLKIGNIPIPSSMARLSVRTMVGGA